MKKIILFLLFTNVAYSQERLKVEQAEPTVKIVVEPRIIAIDKSSDNVSRLEISSFLNKISGAITKSSYEEYSECVTGGMLNKNKDDVVYLFVNHRMSMSVMKYEIISATKTSARVMVKYSWTKDYETKEIVSKLTLKKQKNGELLLSEEKVISSIAAMPDYYTEVDLGGCAGGRCNR